MIDVSSLSVRLAGIVREAVGVLARLGPKGVVPGPVLVAIFGYVQRRLLRFERLMARVGAGEATAVRRPVASRATPHPAPAALRPKPHEGEGEGRSSRTAPMNLHPTPLLALRVRPVSLVPSEYAWAVKMAAETAVFGSQLQALLAEPGVDELLRRTPEAGAILRPLCRMLAVSVPDALRPPGWTPKPERVRVRRKRRKRYTRGRLPGELWAGEHAWRAYWTDYFARKRARKGAWRPP